MAESRAHKIDVPSTAHLEVAKMKILNGDSARMLDEIPSNSVNLVVSSPPYNIGKAYEKGKKDTLEQYLVGMRVIAAKLVDKLKPDGNLCWQVGNYIKDGELYPLDIYFFEIFKSLGLQLRNRIIWHFNFGLHAQRRLSGRYETLLWFSKSDEYTFNLDPIRVPQLYPGKRHSARKGDLVGMPSGNPMGKNPSDVWQFSAEEAFKNDVIWELPNVKANHPEKTIHPCQYPSELAERCILAFTNSGETVLDPFSGVGTSLVAAARHGRLGVGIEQSAEYVRISGERLRKLELGELPLRAAGKAVRKPRDEENVARIPKEWLDLK